MYSFKNEVQKRCQFNCHYILTSLDIPVFSFFAKFGFLLKLKWRRSIINQFCHFIVDLATKLSALLSYGNCCFGLRSIFGWCNQFRHVHLYKADSPGFCTWTLRKHNCQICNTNRKNFSLWKSSQPFLINLTKTGWELKDLICLKIIFVSN